ncbi:helix-turn-helix domain-containing protein [Nocardioides aquiterrae]|uniref:Cytoskeleton protein RodZ-like C-terminal domain-containing protein n=1 Tax=Nocardioides aquiterrae TaxID=203799 RepID=A0ABN1UIR0_9ACTN
MTSLVEEKQGSLEVRTDARVAGAVGAVAAIVAIAYLTRTVGGGSWLDGALALVTGAIAVAHLQSLLDGRVPLVVVDGLGVRIRKGRTWRGLPWDEIEYVEHEPRRGPFRDGRLVLVPRDPEADHPSVTLSLSTRVVGADGDLTRALELLAGNPDQVVELVPEQLDEWDAAYEEDTDEDPHENLPEDRHEDPHHPVLHDPRPTIARGIGFVADRLLSRDREPAVEAPAPVASATPLPLRDTVIGVRSEVRFEGAAALRIDPVDDEDVTQLALPEVGELTHQFDPLLVDDLAPEVAADPVIGPEIAAARGRLSLSVDQLAERTRIRPHVIESIEVDDFAPCGGDFYARGHLRTLARVLGLDAAPLLASYDERYADAPIDARRVFEAELATREGGPIRSTRGGPNWSVLVAAVMAVVLAWSIARLIMDSPVELHSTPVLNGSPSSGTKLGPAVPVVLDASAGGAHVVVRDGAGSVVFNGDLAFGDSRTIKAAPPVRVQSSDGGLRVTVDGQDRGPLGADGQPAQNTFAAAE